MLKLFFFDCETTGLDDKMQDIIQMSWEYEGHVRSYNCKPARPENIDEKALKKIGLTREEIMSYPEPQEAMWELMKFLNLHIGGRYTSPRVAFVAHNASFDWGFFRAFFERYIGKKNEPHPFIPGKLAQDAYAGNYFISAPICSQHAYATAVALGRLAKPENFQLETLAKIHRISLEKAHDARYDMLALRDLFYDVLCPVLKWEFEKQELYKDTVNIPANLQSISF